MKHTFPQAIVTLLLALVLTTTVSAQPAEPTWELKHRDAVLLKTSVEDDTANTVRLTRRELRGGRIRLVFDSPANDSGLIRTLLITDANDRELHRVTGQSLQQPARRIRKWLKKTDQLILSTMAIPSDPDKAAIVRVRWVILCRLKKAS